jgi:hypothetical protein
MYILKNILYVECNKSYLRRWGKYDRDNL